MVLFMVAADEPRSTGENMIIERLKTADVPVILVVNKIDKVHPDALLKLFQTILRKWILPKLCQFGTSR